MTQVRRLGAALLCVALAMSFVGCQGGDSTTDARKEGVTSGEPIKIGAVLSLTGTYSALGAPEKNAIQLEVERINAAGGVEGRPIEVIIEDDATDEAKAVVAATKLIEQDGVVAILGATGTGQSMAIRGDIQRAGVPQVSMAGGTAITQELDPLVFQTPWSNTIVVPFVLEAIETAGYTKLGLITDSGGYGKDGRAIILEEAKIAGLTITGDETFNPGDTDMTAQLTKIRASGAEALLMWSAGKEAALIAKNREQLGWDVPLFGGSGQARKEFVAGAGSAAEGFTFGTGKILIPETWGKESKEYAAATDFVTRYEARFSDKPDVFAGHAYDALNIVVEALKRAGADADSSALREEIEATKDFVGMGGTFSYSATDHNGLTSDDLQLYRVSKGAWVAAE